MSKIAFVLGNGTSRQQVSIPQLKEHAPVYACNAVYRECAVDHLVAVDTKMIMEIADNDDLQESREQFRSEVERCGRDKGGGK